MIKGVKKTHLTVENILKRISEFDIFRFYMRGRFELNRATHSPFHVDDNPSFVIGNKYGTLYFIDFADTSKRGDCFEFVMHLFGISMNDALSLIDRDFGLGILPEHNTGEYKRIKSSYKQPEEIGKRYSIIQVVTRPFTKEELSYWNQYHQSIDDLRANNVYSLSKVYFNRKLFPLKSTELRFGYLYGSSWKIYRPFGSKKTKWVPNNVPLKTCTGLENLNPDSNSLVCKSLKDQMVCKKVYEHVCHVQNESLAAFSEETVNYLNSHSKSVFYGGDSDDPGKNASYDITKSFGFKHINPPDNLLPDIKDFAGWGKDKGLEELREHFIRKGLIV